MRVRRREKVKAAGGMVLWFGKCAAGKNERRLCFKCSEESTGREGACGMCRKFVFLCNIVYMPACFLSLLLFWYGTG